MALKRFHYTLGGDGKFKSVPPLGSMDRKDVIYIGRQEYKSGNRRGTFHKYFIAPGFYVLLFSSDTEPENIDAIADESQEADLRRTLEERLKINLNLFQLP